WEDFCNTDVEPTRKLAELSIEKGVKRFFYVSSIAIYDAGIKSQTITEKTSASKNITAVSPYARSKVENEKILIKLHNEKGLPLVIFRPGIVLGQNGPPYHWGIVACPFNSVCRIWGDGNNKLPIVMVEDISDAMVKAIDIANIEGESYNLVSPPTLTANDYIDEFEKRAGISIKRVITSKIPYYLGELIKWSIKRIGKDPDAAFPSYAEIKSRSFASIFDSEKAEKQLGWQPTKNYDELVSKGIYDPVDKFIN
ncbi:MAG: nucleoside-diphosphate-sugar epimerase, partial [Enterobacterales bacterium]